MTPTLEQMEQTADNFLAVVSANPGITRRKLVQVTASDPETIKAACDFARDSGLLFPFAGRYYGTQEQADAAKIRRKAKRFGLRGPATSPRFIFCAASFFANTRPDYILSDAEQEAEIGYRAKILKQFAAEAKESFQQNRFAEYLSATNEALADPERRREFIQAVVSLLSDYWNWRGDQPKGEMSARQLQEVMDEIRKQHNEYMEVVKRETKS
jgi:hypothetical protein